jgi:hypothetical protein
MERQLDNVPRRPQPWAPGENRKALFSGVYDAGVNPDFQRKDAKNAKKNKNGITNSQDVPCPLQFTGF